MRNAPEQYIPLSALPIPPGTTESAWRRKLARIAARSRQARKLRGQWHLHRDDLIDGRPAHKHLCGTGFQPVASTCGTGLQPVDPCGTGLQPVGLPAGSTTWSTADHERHQLTRLLVRGFAAFVAARSGPRAALAGAFAAESARAVFADPRIPPSLTVADHCTAHGLKCTAASLRRYRRRLPVDGNVDRRGRASAPGAPDQRLMDLFLGRMLHQNQFSISAAWRDVRDLAEELDLWCPSLCWWQRHYRNRVPAYAKGRGRKKRKDFEAEELPKIHRTYGDIAPLEWISLDGHVLNILCRVPCSRRGWRTTRPVLTAALDIRTRMFVGWDIRPTENSDGILAGLKMMHRDFGCARHYYADNGEAYKASIGARRRIRPQLLDDPRIGNLAAQTGAQRHNALPYSGWAKMIESTWNFLGRDFEPYWRSYWGGRTGTRPEQSEKLRIDQRPTLAEVVAGWRAYLDVYHATEQHGDGMYGLTPTLALEQFRTEVRQLAPGVLDFLCCRLVGPRTVTRDGVTYNNIRYGHFDVDVWRHKGKQVWLRVDPDQAEYVWLCDAQGAPLCKAGNRTLTGATQEEVREAARIRAQMRRIAREYHQARDFLLDTNIQQIMRTKRARARAREEAQRAQLPAAAEPAVTIVRPDLTTAVSGVTRRARREALRRDHGAALEPHSDVARKRDELLATPTTDPPAEPVVNPADLLGRYADVG